MAIRTKAELVAAFLVAYCVLLATAGDLQRWAATPTFDARACPGTTVHIACRALTAARRTGSGRERGHSSASRTPAAALIQRTSKYAGRVSGAGIDLRVRLGHQDRLRSRLYSVEVRPLKRRVVAEVASLRARSAKPHVRVRHTRAVTARRRAQTPSPTG
jgi:hypothetical protein